MFFESVAFAMGPAPQGGTGSATEMLVQFVPLILMVAVFWFLLIRPQKKRQQEHKNMLANLRRGDRVVTSGGLIGRIIDVDGDIFTIDLGKTEVQIGRGFISGLFDARVQQAVREQKKGKGDKGDKSDRGDREDRSQKADRADSAETRAAARDEADDASAGSAGKEDK